MLASSTNGGGGWSGVSGQLQSGGGNGDGDFDSDGDCDDEDANANEGVNGDADANEDANVRTTPTPMPKTAEQRYARPESSDITGDDPRAVTLPIQRSSPTSSLRQNQSALARASRQSREMMSGDEEGGGCCGWDCEEPTPGVGQLIDDTAGGMNDVQGDSSGGNGRGSVRYLY